MSIAIGEFQNLAFGVEITGMQTSAEIRRQRLNMLVDRYGTIADLNEALGWARTDPKLTQIKNNNKRPGREATYQMGDAMAREIEEKLNLQRGWMDNPPSYHELLGEEDPRAKVLELMEHLPRDQWHTVVRVVDAISKPPQGNGTTGR